MEDRKKEKVIHTRITDDLDQQIKKEARSLGVSVSTLVRNILTNTFDLVEGIVSDSASIARSVGRVPTLAQPPQAAPMEASSVPAAPGRVVGWQEAILNLNAICDECNGILTKGSRAAFGVVDGAGPRPIICINCLEVAIHGDTGSNDTNQ